MARKLLFSPFSKIVCFLHFFGFLCNFLCGATMRKCIPYLFGTVSVLFVVPFAHAAALSFETAITVAESSNIATVANNFANAGGINIPGQWHHVGSAITNSSFNGSEGVATESQNAGANSVIQNAVSLAYVASCATCLRGLSHGLDLTTGRASNTATVSGNLDYPGYGMAGGGTGGGGTGGGSAGNTPGNHGLVPQGSDPFATITNSFNGSLGAFSTVQNAGNNSALQSAISIGVTKDGSTDNGTLAGSFAKNIGTSQWNVAYSLDTPTSSTIENSFNGSSGIFSSAQNSGSNSMMQNSISVTYSEIKPASQKSMAMSAAISENSASAIENFSNAQRQINTSNLQNSFNGSSGVLISSQNAGANSVIQNSISIGSMVAIK